MLNATSPPKMWLYRVAVVLPGVAASKINPTAR
jgi:hypothetical protein